MYSPPLTFRTAQKVHSEHKRGVCGAISRACFCHGVIQLAAPACHPEHREGSVWEGGAQSTFTHHPTTQFPRYARNDIFSSCLLSTRFQWSPNNGETNVVFETIRCAAVDPSRSLRAGSG